MERIRKAKFFLPALGAGAAAVVILILIFAVSAKTEDTEENQETAVYDYTEEEQQLADAVRAYLEGYLVLDAAESMEIADAAVKSYHTVLSSGIRNVTEEHTKALSQRMRHALEETIGTERVADEGLDALAEGTCGVIWDFILAHIDDGGQESREEFAQLSESLQEQIDELKEKELSVKISANIKDKGISREELENELEKSEQGLWEQMGEGILGLKDSIWAELDSRFGNIRSGTDGKDGENGKNGADGKDGENGKNGADGQNGTNGRDGRDGKDGEDGRDGKDGVDGKDGEDGRDGRTGVDGKDGKDGEDGRDGTDGESVYIMFSEYPDGRDADGVISMSTTQSNTTKYIGTAHTGEKIAPQEPEAYTWSEYKDYIIYMEPDEDGIPTVYIQ